MSLIDKHGQLAKFKSYINIILGAGGGILWLLGSVLSIFQYVQEGAVTAVETGIGMVVTGSIFGAMLVTAGVFLIEEEERKSNWIFPIYGGFIVLMNVASLLTEAESYGGMSLALGLVLEGVEYGLLLWSGTRLRKHLS